MKMDYYNDIIILLAYFQNRTDGIRQKHFRHALMNNENEQLPDEENMMKSFEKIGMVKFFEKMNLPLCYKWGIIKKGSITTQKNLTYYLKHLLKNKVIGKINKKKPFRYKLMPEFYNEYNKMGIREHIDRWDSDNNFKREYFFEKYASSENIKHVFGCSEGREEWTIFGLPRKLDKMFTKDEINDITTHLKRVEESLWKIIELKYKKTIATMEERVKTATTKEEKIGQKIDNDKLASIAFFYHGKKIPEYND